MRLLISFSDQKQGQALSAFLSKENIENKLEILANRDWGSPDYGNATCKIWIIDEDHFEEAKQIAEEFASAPDDQRFYTSTKQPLPQISPTTQSDRASKRTPSQEPMGKLTYYLIILCSLILFFSELSAPSSVTAIPPGLPAVPFVMPQLYKDLMFDYPHAYEILDKLASAYGTNALLHAEDLPAEGRVLLQQFYQTPYWKGFYEGLVQNNQIAVNAPLFEKERQGEIWRLFTPCLLHGAGQHDIGDILHLVFNMLWLALLGRQMESRMKRGRYLLFILLVGVISNIAQYLMGGANFLGFSGVVCGMLAFICVRRRDAAWEGYQLQPGTVGFFAFVILLMFGMQLSSFISEYFFGYHISPGIANTAHLSGLLCGYILGKLRFFAWKMT